MEKTHWKKNLDSKFISGEDLKSSLNGLAPEMIVQLIRTNDNKTFDKNQSKDVTVSALYLADMNGKELYKPCILNRTNAKFFIKETNSEMIEDWFGKPVVMYACKDSRHGYVVRFKSYVMPTLRPNTPEFEKCKTAIEKSGFTIEQIRKKYQVSTEVEKMLYEKV